MKTSRLKEQALFTAVSDAVEELLIGLRPDDPWRARIVAVQRVAGETAVRIYRTPVAELGDYAIDED